MTIVISSGLMQTKKNNIPQGAIGSIFWCMHWMCGSFPGTSSFDPCTCIKAEVACG